MSNLEIQYVEPEYGKHYAKGYAGFTYHKDHIFAHGTAWFTRWDRMSDIIVTHALLVTGENECVEAVGSGVRKSDLQSYFDDPECQIFFRKPRGLNDDIAERLKQKAYPEIGKAYDNTLIVDDALYGTLLGRLLNACTGGNVHDWLSRQMDEADKWICSELVAYCLDSQPEYRDKGILSHPNCAINPQQLFEDDEIFAPWKKPERT